MTNKITFYFLLLLVSVSFTSCHQSVHDHAQSGSLFIRDSLVKHIIVLASDSFQGRKPFTLGETRTVDYLQNQFRSLGLEPGNGNSYLQEVPMVQITPIADPQMKVEYANGSFDLNRATDYVLATENTDSVISLTKANSYLQVMVWWHRNITGMIMPE